MVQLSFYSERKHFLKSIIFAISCRSFVSISNIVIVTTYSININQHTLWKLIMFIHVNTEVTNLCIKRFIGCFIGGNYGMSAIFLTNRSRVIVNIAISIMVVS